MDVDEPPSRTTVPGVASSVTLRSRQSTAPAHPESAVVKVYMPGCKKMWEIEGVLMAVVRRNVLLTLRSNARLGAAR